MKRLFTGFLLYSLFSSFAAFAQPTLPATSFQITASTTTTINLQWTNQIDAERDGYVLRANTTGTFAALVGALPTTDTNVTDGTGAAILAGSATTYTLFTFNPGTRYYFEIVPYKTAGPAYCVCNTAVNGFTEPTQATDILFPNIQATTTDLNWTNGGGTNRIVVGRAGASVTYVPVDGADITTVPSTNFTAGTNSLGSGNILLYMGPASGPLVGISNLTANTQYTFRVFEYVGSAALTNFNAAAGTNNPVTRNTLFAEPSPNQASQITFATAAATTMSLNWANGSGTGRVVIGRASSPVSYVPADGASVPVTANLNITNAGSDIAASGNHLLFTGGSGPIIVTGLVAGTTYYFQIFEFNGAAATTNFLTSTATDNPKNTTFIAQATALSFTPLTNVLNNSMIVNWTDGAGSGPGGRILVAKQGSAVDWMPTDDVTYTPGTNDFSMEADQGGGNKVVAVASGATISGLTANTTYHYRVYEYNGTPGNEKYSLMTAAGNPGSQVTRNEPLNHATAFAAPVATATSTSITLNWTDATGSPTPVSYMLLGRNKTTPTAFATVVDQTLNSEDVNIGTGNGEHSISFVTQTYSGFTGINAGEEYEFQIYPYNTAGGVNNPDFKTDGVVPTVAVFAEPSAQPSLSVGTPTPNSLTLTIGAVASASGGFIAIRNTTVPTMGPMDGTVYTLGQNLGGAGAGDIVAYIGTNGAIVDSPLLALTTYNYRVYSVSGTGTQTNYRLTTPATGSGTTACTPPAGQATFLLFPGIGANDLTISWTSSAAINALVVVKNGSTPFAPVIPNNYESTDNLVFGSAPDIEPGGGVTRAVYAGPVVAGAGNSITVTGLANNNTYFFAIYEYNTIGTCYNLVGPANGSQLTPNVDFTSTFTAGTGAATIASTVQSAGAAVSVFTFTATDVGGPDGVSTRINQIIFRKKAPENDIAVWSDLIAGAQLFDDESNGPTNHGTAIITANDITIPSILSDDATDDLGYIESNSNKVYSLRIWLKNPLTGALPATVDGLNIAVSVTAADIVAQLDKSQFLPGTNTNSDFGGFDNGQITVAATQLKIVTQPSTSAIVGVNLPQQPVFEATDANSPPSNRDRNYNAPVTLVSAGALVPVATLPSFTPATFGLATFTDLRFNALGGPQTMTITAGFVSPATSAITVGTNTIIGTATNSVSAAPLINSTTRTVLGFSLQTSGTLLTLSGVTINTNFTPVGKLTNYQLYRNTSDDFTTASNLGAAAPIVTASTITFSGGALGSIDGTTQYYYLVADIEPFFLIASPTITLSVGSADINVTGGKTGPTQTSPAYALQDLTPPNVLTIGLPSADPNTTGTVNFTVTFDEPVTIANDLDFQATGTASGGSETFSNSGSGTVYTVTASTISKEGLFGLTVRKINNSVKDLGNNSLASAFTSLTQYTVYVPQPLANPGSFSIFAPGTTTTSMTLTWADVISYPIPTGYLITVERSGATAITPVDGTPVADQVDLINFTTGYFNAAPGAGLAVFAQLLSGPTYTYKIYPYTNTGANIDYKTTSPANASGSTPTAAKGSLVSSPTSFIIPNISSLTTASYLPVSVSSGIPTPTTNLFFIIRDDGLSNDDNAKTLFNQIIISKGPASSAFNWDEVIAEAKLVSLIGVTAVVEEAVMTTNISANTITFSGLSTGDERIGEVDDGEQKYYQLYIRFKSPLDNTSGVRALIDGLRFEFFVNGATAFLYDPGSSTIDALQAATSNLTPSTSNTVEVLPTELRLVQQPTSALTGVAMAPAVTVEATDQYGNRDRNNTSSVTFTSTGTLSGVPTATLATGLGTASPVVHSDRGTNRTLSATATGLILNPLNSNTFNITPSAASDIVLDGTFAESNNILYANFQSSNIVLLPPNNGVDIARFIIRDGGGVDADLAPTLLQNITFSVTNSAALRRIALYDNLGNELPGEQNANSTVTFSGLNYGPADGLTKTFTVRVTFQNTSAVVDNSQVQFTITNATTTSPSSDFVDLDALAGGPTNLGAVSSIAGNENRIEVVATQYVFTNPLAPQSIFANVTTSSVFGGAIRMEARDNNLLMDTDYGQNATVTTNIIPKIPLTDGAGNTSQLTITYPFLSGVLLFPAGFRYDNAGNGTVGDGTLLITETTPQTLVPPPPAAAIPSQSSVAITVISDNKANIVSTGFTYNKDLEYIKYPQSSIDISPANPLIPNPATDNEVQVAEFTIQDNGGGPNDADVVGTELTGITLNITNAQFINRLALYNGAVELGEVLLLPLQTSVSFGPFSVLTTDNGTQTLRLFATFKNTVTDNAQIGFNVTSATANPQFSTFASPTAGGAATPSDLSQDNKLEVVATRIDYTTIPLTASLNVPFSVIAEAKDINTNTDLDYNGTISSFTTTPGSPTFITANNPTGVFTNGVKSFPGTFQFTTGNGATQLILNSGVASTPLSVNAGAIAGTSAVINIITSFDSWMYFDPSFTYTTQIDFVPFQSGTTTNASQALGRIILSDGGAPGSIVNPVGIKNLPFGSHNDLDGAPTTISDFTISLTNFGDINKIGLFTVGGVKIGADQNPAATVTFSGLGAYPAPDNDVIAYVIRAEFKPSIIDQHQITMATTAVTHSSGSDFPGATIGGIVGGDATPGTQNILNVIATSLDFTTQASTYAGINEPVGPTYAAATLPTTTAAFVRARDKFTNIDTDFDVLAGSITITDLAGDNITSPAAFINGDLNLDALRYNIVGDGTLRVQAGTIATGPLDSSNPPGANVSAIPGALVNVVHVTATLPGSGIIAGSGSPLTASIKGGSQSQVIFGVTFTANGATGSEPNLTKFSFGFDIPYQTSTQTIFTNFVIKEEAADITSPAINGNFSLVSSASNSNLDIITVDLSAIPRPLFSAPGQSITYYVIADVDASASISTPPITPIFIDAGYSTPSDAKIVTTKGTASGSFNGNVYTFASTKPPVLRTAKTSLTRPFSGQLNVDPAINHILLEFDTKVGTLDGGLNGGAELYNRTTNVKVANLVAPLSAGNFLFTNDATSTITPLRYNIQLTGGPLVADEVYYVLIKQGSFNPLALPVPSGTGISDQGLNFFQGISTNSTLYFKISSNLPPVLTLANATLYNNSVGSISTKFDQFGTAYYLVVPNSSPAPSPAQVKAPGTYLSPKAASGSYSIDQINTKQTVSFPAITSFTSGGIYHVYIYAENDATPTPVPAAGVYGSSLVANTAGPTVTVTLPVAPPIFQPAYLICPNSFVTVSEPIILTEATNSSFSSGALIPGNNQDFNILLPPGYEFDRTTNPTVQLIGSDFNGILPTITFPSNTLVNIRYRNFGAASKDNIVINNLRVIGLSGSPTQSIQRFFGSNTSFPSPTANIGTIGLTTTTIFTFDNSYSTNPFNSFPPGSPAIVNSIPDNYIDPTAPIGTVRLKPIISVTNDYNGSIFTGNGVSGDLLTLSAVTTNAAFNITMSHTDPNGCVSEKVQQYLVYDHVSPISKKLGTSNSTVNLPGSAQALINTAFDSSSPSIPSSSSPPIPSQTILNNELAGYLFVSLTAGLPAEVKSGQVEQIISGPDWQLQVAKLPLPPTAVVVPPLGTYFNYQWDYARILNAFTEQGGTISVDPYYGGITNLGNTIRFDDNFNGNLYWKGGSLGNVEFTGLFRSTADLSVYVPFKQNVEMFVPAVPLVEVGSSNLSAFDNTDATVNTQNGATAFNYISSTFGFQYPSYPGTSIFCEAGNKITLNGYPAALAGASTGSFAIYDFESYDFRGATSRTGTITTLTNSTAVVGIGTLFTTELIVGDPISDKISGNVIGVVQSITNNTNLVLTTPAALAISTGAYLANRNRPLLVPAPSSAFIDNANGSMILDPTLVKNNYNDILVAYTYKQNNSPAVGTGYLIIRITPNPVAQFTIASVVGSPSSAFNAFCSTNAINFDAAPSTIAPPTQAGSTNFVEQYLWDFGDPNSGTQNMAATAQAAHTYSFSSIFDVDLELTSNWGCGSLPVIASTPTNQALDVLYAGSDGQIRVGDIPTVDFSFLGNCVGDNIQFTDNSSTPVSSNSKPANYVWDFDFPNNVTNTVLGNNPGNSISNVANVLPTTFPNFGTSPDGTIVEHAYSAAKNYDVLLTTTTNLGCSNSKKKTLVQLPLKVPTQSADFSEFFDTTDGGWQALDLSGSIPTTGGTSSWVWNDPSTPGKWATKTYNKNEKSALYSTCIDLGLTIPRPVLSYHSYLDLATGEGLVLQYSKDAKNIYDPTKVWDVLGSPANGASPGLEWYNSFGLPSNPGTGYANSNNASGFGWANDQGYTVPKHKLEDIRSTTKPTDPPQNSLPDNRVILRFALSALGNATGKGITIDSLRVGSRTRTVLVENFTTTDGGSNASLNSDLSSEAQFMTSFITNNIASTQVVNINYHIGFVGSDPFNLDNPADPSSRALFYNVTKAPYAFMDGIHSKKNGSDLFQDWGDGAYDLQTLQLANADFKPALPLGTPITTVTNNADGSIEVDVVVKPTRDLPKTTTLHIAILEEAVLKSQLPSSASVTTNETQFNYVLKKLIPNAVGSKYPAGTFQRDVNVHLGPDGKVNTTDKFKWIPNKLYSSKLAVVLFLQDSTREVYQSEFFQNLSAPAPVTGLELLSSENVNVFPNPADEEITIQLPSVAPQRIQLQMVDQVGRVVNQHFIAEGERSKTISTRDLAGGIYLLQLGSGDTSTRKKILVVHGK